ncbi:hypothetical protein K502DRAFT_352557 [Neoconidiobolus thromboides FSU 785]|nr:hypothetical protein K502DRAFT_352557 [Neoconidiobolus thromboides FSU 785]
MQHIVVSIRKNGPLISDIGLEFIGVYIAYEEPGTDKENSKHVYAIGGNELLLSKIPSKRRKDVFLCTEFRLVESSDSFNFIIRGDKNLIEETVKVVAELTKEECNAYELRRAYKNHTIATVQVEYNSWETGIEKNNLLDTCIKVGVTIIAFSRLGQGFLMPELNQENVDHNLQLVEKFQKLSNEKNTKSSQL